MSTAISVVLGACASTTPIAEPITVIRDPAAVKDCTQIAELAVTSGGGGFARDASFAKNQLALQRRTNQRGGDTLLIREEHRSLVRGQYNVYKTFGTAYRCASPTGTGKGG